MVTSGTRFQGARCTGEEHQKETRCRGSTRVQRCSSFCERAWEAGSRTASVRVCEKTYRTANHKTRPRKHRARRHYTRSQRAGDTFSYPQKRLLLWACRFFHRPVSDRDGSVCLVEQV